jgi:hypothetical protein
MLGVKAVKGKADSEIQTGWKKPIRNIPGDAIQGVIITGTLGPEVEVFPKDERSHLLWQPWREVAIACRNT